MAWGEPKNEAKHHETIIMYSTKPYFNFLYHDETDDFTNSLANRYSAYKTCDIDITSLLYVPTTPCNMFVTCRCLICEESESNSYHTGFDPTTSNTSSAIRLCRLHFSIATAIMSPPINSILLSLR